MRTKALKKIFATILAFACLMSFEACAESNQRLTFPGTGESIEAVTVTDDAEKNYDLEFKLNSDEQSYSVTGIGACTDKEINIPDIYNGLSVTGIGDKAFDNCRNLTGVIIPDSIKYVGNSAFANCEKLVNVSIPDSVMEIGQGAFENCESLSDITLPFIGERADGEGNNQFGHIFGKPTTVYDYEKSNMASTYNIPSSLKNVTITGGTIIHVGAFFNCDKIENITIPDGITEIHRLAFKYCRSLKSMVIPDSVTSIGMEVFYMCNSLENIEVPFVGSNVEKSNIDGNNKFRWIFGGEIGSVPKTLSTVVVGGTSIYKSAFYDCEYIKHIIIRDGVKNIGEKAFYDCKGLVDVTIPGSVDEIGKNAFCGCSNLKKVTFRDDGLRIIGDSAFAGCVSLNSLTIPESVTSIGTLAFVNCKELSDITIPDRVESINDRAFLKCQKFRNINIPASVKYIGPWAFDECGEIESITVSKDNTVYHSNGNCLIETESKTLILGCK